MVYLCSTQTEKQMENSRPILQLDLEGNLIKEHPSISKAARQFGGSKKVIGRIHYALGGRANVVNNSNEAYGFKWKYKN